MSFFSCDCVLGMTITVRSPSALPSTVRPMPVLPAVPSTTVPPGRSRPLAMRLGDDAERGAVLDRGAGVHELGLAEDGAAGLLGGAAKLDEGRAADGGGDASKRGRDSLRPGNSVNGIGRTLVTAADWCARKPMRCSSASLRCTQRTAVAAAAGTYSRSGAPAGSQRALLFAVRARYIFARSFPTAAKTCRNGEDRTGASRPEGGGERAGVAELVDALDLGSSGASRGGSSPSARTTR